MKIYDFSAENPIKKYTNIDSVIKDGSKIMEVIIDSLNAEIPIDLYKLKNKYLSWQRDIITFLKSIKVKDDHQFSKYRRLSSIPQFGINNFFFQSQDDKNYLKELKEMIKDDMDSLRLIKDSLENKRKIAGSREEIKLKTLGVSIEGKYIYRKGLKGEEVFTNTEEKLIYFLYFNNKGDHFNTKTLAEKIGTTAGYIKNIIANIHKKMGEKISRDNPPKIRLIVSKPKRGYCLNSKLFI